MQERKGENNYHNHHSVIGNNDYGGAVPLKAIFKKTEYHKATEQENYQDDEGVDSKHALILADLLRESHMPFRQQCYYPTAGGSVEKAKSKQIRLNHFL